MMIKHLLTYVDFMDIWILKYISFAGCLLDWHHSFFLLLLFWSPWSEVKPAALPSMVMLLLLLLLLWLANLLPQDSDCIFFSRDNFFCGYFVLSFRDSVEVLCLVRLEGSVVLLGFDFPLFRWSDWGLVSLVLVNRHLVCFCSGVGSFPRI